MTRSKVNWYLGRTDFYKEEVNPVIAHCILMERITIITAIAAVIITIGYKVGVVTTPIVLWLCWMFFVASARSAVSTRIKIRKMIAIYDFHQV